MSYNDVAPIFLLLREITRAFRRRLEDETRLHDLTMPQWRIIAALGKSDGFSQIALANAVDSDPMTMSGVLRRLASRGLVTREPDPNDSRAKIVRLTAEGEVMFQRVAQLGAEIYQSAIADMSAAEIEAVSDGLARMRDNLNSVNADQKDQTK